MASEINVLAMERNTTGDLVIKYAQGKIIAKNLIFRYDHSQNHKSNS